MKKIIILLLPLLILTGCKNKEKLFEKYAREYYENHMKMVGNVDNVTITLDDLKKGSIEDNYDLSKLKNCENTSKVTFEIDKTTKEIKNTKLDIKC